MKNLQANKKSIHKDNQTISGVIGSTGTEDRHGDRVNPKGWKLEKYLQNPVVMFGHNYDQLPVGKATNVYEKNGKLMFDIKFASTEFAKEVFSLYADGFLNAVSVGFQVLKWGKEKSTYNIDQQELLELSCVPIPANSEALVAKGIDADYKNKLHKIDQEYTSIIKPANNSSAELGKSIERIKTLEKELKGVQKAIAMDKPEPSLLKELHKELKQRDKEIGIVLREWKNLFNNQGGEK